MKPDSHIYNRKTIRLQGYDYSGAGSYFVTICTRNRESFFGIVLVGEMRFNNEGRIAMKCWESLPERFPEVSLDESVFMPNHLHGIINIAKTGVKYQNSCKGVMNCAPIHHALTLGMVVRSFKALASRQIRLSGKNEFGWQRNYYEHIIRNEDSLKHIREYITTNPLRWELDSENLDRKGEDEFDQWLNINKLRRDKSSPYR